MTDQSYHVYVIQGRGQRDYSDCQAALAHVPARMTALPFLRTEDEVIAKTRDADALVTSASPVTRSVMSALEGLKVVARTRVGYDVIESIERLSRPILAFRPRYRVAVLGDERLALSPWQSRGQTGPSNLIRARQERVNAVVH